jgi:hypothetical protein
MGCADHTTARIYEPWRDIEFSSPKPRVAGSIPAGRANFHKTNMQLQAPPSSGAFCFGLRGASHFPVVQSVAGFFGVSEGQAMSTFQEADGRLSPRCSASAGNATTGSTDRFPAARYFESAPGPGCAQPVPPRSLQAARIRQARGCAQAQPLVPPHPPWGSRKLGAALRFLESRSPSNDWPEVSSPAPRAGAVERTLRSSRHGPTRCRAWCVV